MKKSENQKKLVFMSKLLAVFATVMLFSFLAGAPSAFSQGRTISGTVTTESGEPIAGASVVVKGTTTGTTSGTNGHFSIVAPQGSTLVISSVNYRQQEIRIGSNSSVSVKLVSSEAADLGEVVVVGYGTQRRKDVTGSISSINNQALHEVPGAVNLVQALTGRIAGVDIARSGTTPGSGGQIRIRGNRSLNGTNDPFFVLDGIPFGGNLNDLNPDDIASIDILKDASATAIYGSRGSNGVIIITTKRGKPGKPQVTYNGIYGITKIVDQYDVFTGPEFKTFRDLSGYGGTAPYDVAEQAGIAAGTSTNWQDYLFKNGFQTNHELGVSGGNDGTTYGISGGYQREEGVITGQSFERFALRSTVDFKIGKRVKVGLNSLNSLTYINGAGFSPIFNTIGITPLVSAFNPDGTPNLKPQPSPDASSTMHPITLENRNAIIDRQRRLRTFNSLYGEVEIITGLKYRLNVGLDFRQENYGIFRGPNTILNAAATTPRQATASVRNGESWTATVENVLSYDKTFAQKHRVTATALFSFQRDRGFNTRIDGNDFPAEAIQYYNFNLAQNQIIPTDGNNFSKSGLVSYMGRVFYSYDDRYMLTATFRRDGSSNFPIGRWLDYPAFALGWNISNEGFMKNVNAVNNLKLRLGYGMSGNQGIPGDAATGTLSINRYNFGATGANGFYITGLANQNLTWESTENYNAGIDFSLFKDRISGSFDIYRQITDKLLVQKALPLSNGVNSVWTNAAKTQGHGIEISLSGDVIKTKGGFTWSMDLNFAINREEIVALEDAVRKQNVGNGWFVGQPINVIYDFKKVGIWQISEAAQAASFGSADFAPGRIKLADISGPDGKPDGKITADDRTVVGTFQPDWVGGMTQRFTYKNFDLSTVLFARMGNSVVVTYLTNDGSGTGHYAFGSSRWNQWAVDYWTPTNPTNAFPIPQAGAALNYSSVLGYYDGSFIKMRSINLGYTLPASILRKTGLQSARIYVTAENPFILYSPLVKAGLAFDPEGTGFGGAVQTTGGAGSVQGRAITLGETVPPVRKFIIGVNIRL
jgi:TonB-dependent starch-binding outer membrane protein SusC